MWILTLRYEQLTSFSILVTFLDWRSESHENLSKMVSFTNTLQHLQHGEEYSREKGESKTFPVIIIQPDAPSKSCGRKPLPTNTQASPPLHSPPFAPPCPSLVRVRDTRKHFTTAARSLSPFFTLCNPSTLCPLQRFRIVHGCKDEGALVKHATYIQQEHNATLH